MCGGRRAAAVKSPAGGCSPSFCLLSAGFPSTTSSMRLLWLLLAAVCVASAQKFELSGTASFYTPSSDSPGACLYTATTGWAGQAALSRNSSLATQASVRSAPLGRRFDRLGGQDQCSHAPQPPPLRHQR